MPRFTHRDENDLRWYFAGGLELELSSASIWSKMVDVLSRGAAGHRESFASPEPPGEAALEAAARHRRLAKKLRAVSARDAVARRVLWAAFGVPPLPARNPLRATWGARASVLLASPVARENYLRSDTTRSFGEWLVRLPENKDARPLVASLASDIDRLYRRAITVWEDT